MDDPFTPYEFEFAIDSSKRNSFPGLDRVDYSILHSLFPDFRNFLFASTTTSFRRVTFQFPGEIRSSSLNQTAKAPSLSFHAFLNYLNDWFTVDFNG